MSRTATWFAVFAGPALWFGQQLLLHWLRPVACARAAWLLPAIAIACALSLAVIGLASTRELHADAPRKGPANFLALIASAMPLLFAAAIAWQLAATLWYSPCER